MRNAVAITPSPDGASPAVQPTPVAVIVEEGSLSYRERQVLQLVARASHLRLVWVGLARTAPIVRLPYYVGAGLDWLSRRSKHTRGRIEADEFADRVRPLAETEWLALLKSAAPGAGGQRPALIILLAARPDLVDVVSRAGIALWRYASDDGGAGSRLEGLSAVARGEPVSRVALHEHQPGQHDTRVLGLVESRTHPTSPALNRALLSRASIRLVAEALEARAFPGPDQGSVPPPPSEATVAPPVSARDAIPLIGRALTGGIRSRYSGETDRVQWTVGVGAHLGTDLEHTTLEDIHWLPTDATRYFADPFPIEHNGRLHLFVEEYRYADRRGFISLLDPEDPQAAAPVLAKPFHLSFPNVFDHDGEFFMLPEQGQSQHLVLYRSHDFPHDWRPEATLLEQVAAVDPVLFRRDDLWWLMFSRADYGGSDNNLQLYFASEIQGPYRRHPESPIRECLRGARMAGRLFEDRGRLIRPAQDCLRRYGGALIFHEVLELNPEHYRERELRIMDLAPTGLRLKGMHTFNRIANHIAVDGFRYLRR